MYPAGSRKVQAGKSAPLPGGQREKVAPYRFEGDRATRRQSYCAAFYLSASVKKGQVAAAPKLGAAAAGRLTDR